MTALTISSERLDAHTVVVTDTDGLSTCYTYPDCRWAGDVHRVMRALARVNVAVLATRERVA